MKVDCVVYTEVFWSARSRFFTLPPFKFDIIVAPQLIFCARVAEGLGENEKSQSAVDI